MDTATSVSFASRSAASQGFAIPIDAVLAVSHQIEAGVGSSSVHIGPTGFLGIQIAGSDSASGSQPSGVLLAGVLPGLPAEQAGLAQGDVITALDGRLVSSDGALLDLLVPHHPGDAVQLSWLDQSGQTHSATLRLASGPPA
jgi:S1-C subfamily serine protease